MGKAEGSMLHVLKLLLSILIFAQLKLSILILAQLKHQVE